MSDNSFKDEYEQILAFWFGPSEPFDDDYKFNSRLWWGASAATDADITARFRDLVEEVAQIAGDNGGMIPAVPLGLPLGQEGPPVPSAIGIKGVVSRFSLWRSSPLGCLALILLLDQFPRNIFRGSAKAFGTDTAALELARHLVLSGATLAPAHQLFVLLCYEHSEDADTVRTGVQLIDELVSACLTSTRNLPKQGSLLRNHPKTFRQHLALLERYGRYPYRNAALGRATTEEEWTFLQSKDVPTFARRTMKLDRGAGAEKKEWAPNKKVALLKAAGIELEAYSQTQRGGDHKDVEDRSGTQEGQGGTSRVVVGDPPHAATPPAPLGKILFLHCFRSGTKQFSNKTGKLRSLLREAGFAVVYAEACHQYDLKGPALAEALEKFGGELPNLEHQRVWWMAEGVHFATEEKTNKEEGAYEDPAAPDRDDLLSKNMRYDGVEKALAGLETDLATKGPFVGVLGFAQGATMAALLVQRLCANAFKTAQSATLKFAVFISGYPPRDERYRDLFAAGALTDCGVATFHTWGEKDILIEPVRCTALVKAFGNDPPCSRGDGEGGDHFGSEVVVRPHPGAHFVPNMWPTEAIVKFCSEQFQNVGAGEGPKSSLAGILSSAGSPADQCMNNVVSLLSPFETDVRDSGFAMFSRTKQIADLFNSSKKPGCQENLRTEIDRLTVTSEQIEAFVQKVQNQILSGKWKAFGGASDVVDDVEDHGDLDLDAGAGECDSRHEKHARIDHTVDLLLRLADEAWQLGTKGRPKRWGDSEAEAVHGNRSPDELRVFDLGFFFFLQARRLDPGVGHAGLFSGTDPGCGWSGLTRLYALLRASVLVRSYEEDLMEEIPAFLASTLHQDMDRCLPPEWCAYFSGTDRSAPGEEDEDPNNKPSRPARAVAAALRRVQEDDELFPSACALGVPSPYLSVDKKLRLAHTIGAHLFPNSPHMGRFRELLSVLRAVLTHKSPRKLAAERTKALQNLRAAQKQTLLFGPMIGSAAWNKRAEAPLSDAVLNPEPEPVVVSQPAELEPLFAFLRETTMMPVTSVKKFTRGALVPDGRLDLCKQVVGPAGIGPLCEALGAAYGPGGVGCSRSSFLGGGAGGGGPGGGAEVHFGDDMVIERIGLPQKSAENGATLTELNTSAGDENHTIVQEVAAPAPVGHSVTRLLLGNNIVGNGGGKDIAALIKSGKSTITTWYIAGNRFDVDGISPICDALAHDRQVDMLWLKRNPLKLPGARLIASLLQKNRMIHTLDLDNTGLLDDGAIAVLDALTPPVHNSVLKHLYLNSNGLGPRTAQAIKTCIAHPDCTLKQLIVGTNRFGDEGAISIAEGLSKNSTLERLSLPSNRIGPMGAGFLAEALRANTSLTSLNLGFSKATGALGELGNCVLDEGASRLADALRTNKTLRELDVVQNGLTQKGMDYFLGALRGDTGMLGTSVVVDEGSRFFGFFFGITAGIVRFQSRRARMDVVPCTIRTETTRKYNDNYELIIYVSSDARLFHTGDHFLSHYRPIPTALVFTP